MLFPAYWIARRFRCVPVFLRAAGYYDSMSFARFLLLCLLAAALLPAQSVDLLPDESLKGWTRIPIPATDG